MPHVSIEEPRPALLAPPIERGYAAPARPLAEVLDDLGRRMGIAIQVDWASLALEGVERETEVHLEPLAAPTPGWQVMALVLNSAGGGFTELGAYEADGSILVTTDDAWNTFHRRLVVYGVGPLLRDMRRAGRPFGSRWADDTSEAASTAPVEIAAEERLIALIADTIGTDDAWDAPPRLRLWITDTVLLVEATPDDQRRVERLLAAVRQVLSAQLAQRD